MPPLIDRLKNELDRAGRAAQNALDEGRLRLEPTRNNQRRRIRWAVEYAIDRWTDEDLHALVTGRRIDRLTLAA